MSELNYEEMIKELNEKYEELRKGKEAIEEQVRKFKEETDRRTNQYLKQISDLQKQIKDAQEKKRTSDDSDVDSIIAEYTGKKVKTEEEIAREHEAIVEAIENNFRARKEANANRNIAESIKNFLTEEVPEELVEEVPEINETVEDETNATSKAKEILNKIVDSAKSFLFEAEENINNAVDNLNDIETLEVPEISVDVPLAAEQVKEENAHDYSLWNDTVSKENTTNESVEEEVESIEDVLEIGDNSAAYDPDKETNDVNNEVIESLVLDASDEDSIEKLEELPKVEDAGDPIIEEIPDNEVKKLETIKDYETELKEQKKVLGAYITLKDHARKNSKQYVHCKYYIDQINATIDTYEKKIAELKEAQKIKLNTKVDIPSVDNIVSIEENTKDIASNVAEDLGIRIGNEATDTYVSEDIEEIDKAASEETTTNILEEYNNRLNKTLKTLESLEKTNKDKIRIESELSKRVDNEDAKRAKNNVKAFEEDGIILTTYKNAANDLNNKVTNLITRMVSINNNDEKQNEFNNLQRDFYDLDNQIEKYLQKMLKNAEKELISVNNRIKLLKKNKRNKSELAFLKDKKKALKKEIRTISLYSSNKLIIKKVIAGLLGTSILATSIIAFASCARNAHKDRDELDDVITTTTYDDEDIYTSLETEIPEVTTTLFTTMPESTTVSETTTAPTTTIETTTTKVETKAPETTKDSTTTKATTKAATTTKETTKKVTTTAEETEAIYEEEVEEVDESLESYNNYNNSYRNEYTMVTNHYGVSNEYAIELVNRAYNIQDAGFYMDASIDDIVLLLIRVDNGELMVFDSQGINDNINEVTTAFITGTTNNDDIRAIKALPYFVSSNSTTRTWLIDYSNILVDILNNPNNSSYKLNAINYLYSLADYIKGMYFGGRFVSQKEYTAATTFYMMYNSFVVPTEALLYDESVVNYYNEVLDELDKLFDEVYEVVCGNTVLVLAPTEGHYIEEETEYVR